MRPFRSFVSSALSLLLSLCVHAAASTPTPNLVVTVNTDDATGNASNCTGPGTPNCGLRDAIAAAAASGSGNITFSPTVFAPSEPLKARTILLNDVLVLSSNTSIAGPTTGSGATLTQLVTITYPYYDTFQVPAGVSGVTLSGIILSGELEGNEVVRSYGDLTISDSTITGNGDQYFLPAAAAINNDGTGTLAIINCIISDNESFEGGGGISNEGTLTVTDSTISGNSATDGSGAGIGNSGTATLTNTTVSDNIINFYNYGGRGGGIANGGTLNLVNSTVTGNSASNPGDGSGIYNAGTLHITNSTIVSNLTDYNETYDYEGFSAVEDDCDGPGCPPEKIPAPPTFHPPSGTYTFPTSPYLSDTTPGAVFFFTTDGSTPTTSSLLSAGEQTFPFASVVKVIAFLNGESSPVATATYTAPAGPCTLVDYSAGFTPLAFTLNGGATVTGGLLQLTDGGFNEARSAFYSTPLPVSEFTTDFQFQLLRPLADGITFTIQSADPHAVGQPGGGLGYAGIPHSIALKFDLFNNSGEGFDSTGYYVDGAYPSAPAINLFPYGIHLHSGHVFAVHITYVGNIFTGTITDLTTYQAYSASVSGDLTKIVGNTAYVGFTGGTGLLTATQNILTWTYGGGSSCGFAPAP